MNWLIAQVSRLNRWYDAQREPGRFLMFIVPMAYAIFGMELGPKYDMKFVTITSFTLFAVLFFIGMTRALRLGGAHLLIGMAMLLCFVIVALGLAFAI